MTDPKETLKEMTSSKKIAWASKGSHAIWNAMNKARELGREILITPDQGGWLTYEKDAKKAGFQFLRIPTDDGILTPEQIESVNPEKTVLLINSMPGYYALQQMEEIAKKCEELGIMIINDVSGSIGRDEAKFGEIKVGSFGRWKPLELGKGGFMASESEEGEEPAPVGLIEALDMLPDRLEAWDRMRQKVVGDLEGQGFRPLKPSKPGINIIVCVESDGERSSVEVFCVERGWPVTICPREIRVLRNAVSVELKRINPLQHQKP